MAAAPLFMVTNRAKSNGDLSDDLGDELLYFKTSAQGKDITKLSRWTELSQSEFDEELRALAAQFPLLPDDRNAEQKHLSLFVHGYNNSWKDSAKRYAGIRRDLFDRYDLGVPVLFSWPSNGSVAAYLPDREDARESGPYTAELFVRLYEIAAAQQRLAARTGDPKNFCRAKISVIGHSMGAFVAQKGLKIAAERLNSPQLITLIHQLALVAADIDNDLFQKDLADEADGSLMANLCYRIGALYTGLDDTLGASAGLKHFGKRRLGRSGLADPDSVWDNVFDIDVTNYIVKENIHSAVFKSPKALALLERILRGVDRHQLPPG
jgi:esterase/lipase superfamily enzyme